MVFVARRKLLALFSLLSAFIVVMTVSHYLYLDGKPQGGGRLAPIGEVPSSKEGAAIKKRPKLELSLDQEIALARSKGRVEFIVKDGKGGETSLGEEDKDTATTADVATVADPIPDYDIPDLSPNGQRYIPRRRVVHLDLKGAPPKLSYLKELMPLFKHAGATTLLVEYEDMFPFWGELKNLSALNAYTKEDVGLLLSYAKASSLEVIPLVQTFGHLEMALKLEEFMELRETPQFSQDLCPSRDGSWKLVKAIIDQVVSLHPESKFLHIGCDEVFNLAQCPVCAERLNRANEDPKATRYYDSKWLFLEHVHRLGKYVRQEMRRIPIIWDDMLRSIPAQNLLDSGIGAFVEPMVWVYVEDVDRFIDPLVWSSLGEVFRHVWTASAFKGAFGERLHAVNIQRHVGNNLAWLEVMKRESQGGYHINFRGVVLTGWSRYDHFAVLCELLPIAVPSLVLNLVILAEGGHTDDASRRANKLLHCDPGKELMTGEELLRNPNQWDLYRCRYPGSNLFSVMASYDMVRKEVEAAHARLTVSDGWMTEYNVRHRFSSTRRVLEAMKGVHYMPGSLKSTEAQFDEVLSQYYDRWTTAEWIEQHVLPLQETVAALQERARALTQDTVWPRRPLADVVATMATVATSNSKEAVKSKLSKDDPKVVVANSE